MEKDMLLPDEIKTSMKTATAALGIVSITLALWVGSAVQAQTQEGLADIRAKAEKGDAQSQNALGNFYFNGNGVPKDEVEALKWYCKAGEQIDAQAIFHLGVLYEKGIVVPKDEVEAARWYRKAAELNDAQAQFTLGHCYLKGRGVERDVASGCKWILLAAGQGLPEAKEEARSLEDKYEYYAYMRGLGMARNFNSEEMVNRRRMERPGLIAQVKAEVLALTEKVRVQAELQAKEAQAQAEAQAIAEAQAKAQAQKQILMRFATMITLCLSALGIAWWFFKHPIRPTCNRCGAKYSLWSSKIGSGMCATCRVAEDNRETKLRPTAKQEENAVPSLSSANSSPNENSLFYYRAKDEEKGPHTLKQLTSMWQNGQITADALYRTSDSSEWLPLAERFAALEPTGTATRKKRHLVPVAAVTMLVVGVCLCLLYASGHHGGTDSVTGTGNTSENARQDAQRQLERLYKSYDVVDANTELIGSKQEHDESQRFKTGQTDYETQTWRCIMRVKNAVPHSE